VFSLANKFARPMSITNDISDLQKSFTVVWVVHVVDADTFGYGGVDKIQGIIAPMMYQSNVSWPIISWVSAFKYKDITWTSVSDVLYPFAIMYLGYGTTGYIFVDASHQVFHIS